MPERASYVWNQLPIPPQPNRARQDVALPPQMTAVVQDGYGGTDVLKIKTLPLPVISAGDVLVQVHAAGLAKGAWHVMTGTPYLLRVFFGLRSPRQPVAGHNLAGTVMTVGEGVTRFKPGDRVYGIGKGSFAGYAAALELKLAPMPEGLDFEQAAAVPVSGLTALQAVADVARVSSGQRVLVTAPPAGWAVSPCSSRWAAGAEVTGVCSAGKAGFVRGLGAQNVLDYQLEDFAASAGAYDAVIDIAGNPSLARLRRALKPAEPLHWWAARKADRVTGGMIERQMAGRFLSMLDRGHRRFGTCWRRRAARNSSG